MESTKMKFTYVRHVLAYSNQPGNTGVHIYDPRILSGQDDEDSGNKGQSLCRTTLLPALADRGYTRIAVSASSRAILTMLRSVPMDTLRTAKITVTPILEEQTHWMSDRPSSVKTIQRLVQEELITLGYDKSNSLLQMNFLPLLPTTWSMDKILDLFEQDSSQVFLEQDRLAQNETMEMPWHTKTELYDPIKLMDRGLAAKSWLCDWYESSRKIQGNPPVAVVFGHGGFVNFMVQEVGNIEPENGELSIWKPGEIREYEVTSSDLFEETADSRMQRLGESVPPVSVEAEKARRQRLLQAVVKLQEDEVSLWEQTDNNHGVKPLYEAARNTISDRVPGTDDYNESLSEPEVIKLDGNVELHYFEPRRPDSELVGLGVPGGKIYDVTDEGYEKDGLGSVLRLARNNAHVYVMRRYTCAISTPPPVGPGAIRDFKMALELVRNRHPELKIITWGWSAGAWLVTRAETNVKVALTICSYGTLSMAKEIRHQPTCENIFGPEATDESISQWDAAHPPVRPSGQLYMLHGNNDTKVKVENTVWYAEMMHAAKVPLRVECVPKGDHGYLRAEHHYRLMDCIFEVHDEVLPNIKPLDFKGIRQKIESGDHVVFQNY